MPDTSSPYDPLPDGVHQVVDKPFTGDFDALVAHRAGDHEGMQVPTSPCA